MRYDALGRRILLRTRQDSVVYGDGQNEYNLSVLSSIERYIWDGSNLLYEIRYPGSGSTSSEDLEQDAGTTGTFDSDFYGRVAYTYGLTIDRPLSMLRIDDGSVAPITIIPHADWRGTINRATAANGKDISISVPDISWIDRRTSAYLSSRPPGELQNWMGDLPEGQANTSGLMYMRNRYYDPQTGRFTQEDPMGLAGGINLYGFADGDPVNYSDPFGLRPLTDAERRALGDMCEQIDCDKVNVYDGHDGKEANARRDLILKSTLGRSITLGHDIYISGHDLSRYSGYVKRDVLAHEMTHVGQYEKWGAFEYYGTAAVTQWIGNSLFGKLEGRRNPEYQVPLPLEPGFNYGMEQMAEIVRFCSMGLTTYCAASPYKFKD